MKYRNISLRLMLVCLALGITACEKPAEKEARYLRLGNAYFEHGDFEKARLEYKNANQLMPTDAEPRYRLGLVDEETGDAQSAFGNYIAAEQQNPHYVPALLKLAQYFMAAELYDQSQPRIMIALQAAPNDAEAHAVHAALLLRHNEYPQCEEEARHALSLDPANVTAFSVLTGLYSAEKDIPKAAATIEEGILRNPQNAALLSLKAALFEKIGNLSKTVEAYNSLFNLKPYQLNYRLALANIYVAAGKTQEAEATQRDAMIAMPDNWELKQHFVNFLAKQKGEPAAENEIHALMTANPSHNELYLWLADIYLSRDEIDKAADILDKVLTKDNTDHSSLAASSSLARIQLGKGNFDLANKLVDAVLAHDSDNADALLVKARLLITEGKLEAAISDLRIILRDNAKDTIATQLLAEVLLFQGRIDLAIDMENQLLQLAPLDFSAKVRLAQMYNLSGDPHHALELLTKVTQLAPDLAVGWESTARIAISFKDWDLAQGAIEKLKVMKGQATLSEFLEAQLLLSNSKPEQSISLYLNVIHADALSPLAEYSMAALVDAYKKIGQLQYAINTINSLAIKPANALALLGQCYQAVGDSENAALAFDKAIETRTPDQSPYIARAQLYMQKSKINEAMEVLKKGEKIAPTDARASMMLANLQESAGDYHSSIATYENILSHNSSIDPAANNLSIEIADYEYQDPAALEKARQLSERFINSKNPLYLDTLAWVYYRQHNMQQSQVIMEQVIKLNTDLPPEIHYHYGSILLKEEKTSEAKVELQKAVMVDKSIDYPGLREARSMLSKL